MVTYCCDILNTRGELMWNFVFANGAITEVLLSHVPNNYSQDSQIPQLAETLETKPEHYQGKL